MRHQISVNKTEILYFSYIVSLKYDTTIFVLDNELKPNRQQGVMDWQGMMDWWQIVDIL